MDATCTQVVVRAVSQAPVQLWQRCPQSRCSCGSGAPSPGAAAAAVPPVPVQLRQRCPQSRCRCGSGGRSPGADAPIAARDLRQLWRDRIRDLLVLRVDVAAELEPIGEALPRSSSRPPVRRLFGAALCAHAEGSRASGQLARRMHASVTVGSGRTHTHACRVTIAQGRRRSARTCELGQARHAGANSPASVQVWRG